MSTANPTPLKVTESLQLLKKLSCVDAQAVESELEKQQLREALLSIVQLSEYQNLGICADSVDQAVAAASSYLTAFGYPVTISVPESQSLQGPVYLKYNTKQMSHYVNSYKGEYRGVLVACQDSETEEINGTYGHFPLDLFEEKEC